MVDHFIKYSHGNGIFVVESDQMENKESVVTSFHHEPSTEQALIIQSPHNDFPMENVWQRLNDGQTLCKMTTHLNLEQDKTAEFFPQRKKIGKAKRYLRPICISVLIITFTLCMTFSVLYWNYHGTLHRKNAVRRGSVILDHWGKTAPAIEETKNLKKELEVEILTWGDIFNENSPNSPPSKKKNI